MSSLISVIAAPARSTRQSLLAATYFAVMVAAASSIIAGAYTFAHAPGAPWAIVSATLVLYPGVNQSFTAALLRIAANFLGTGIGFAVGYYFGTDLPQVIVALVGVIFAGELLRMDLALRTACVASVIVMTANDHNIKLSIIERLLSVTAGCLAALAVTMLLHPFRDLVPFIANSEVIAAPTPSPAAPVRPAEVG